MRGIDRSGDPRAFSRSYNTISAEKREIIEDIIRVLDRNMSLSEILRVLDTRSSVVQVASAVPEQTTPSIPGIPRLDRLLEAEDEP